MNEIYFKAYLISLGCNKKVCSDHISRLKRVEKSIADCDLDIEFDNDKCQHVLCLFSNKGESEELKKVLTDQLPIGSYAMNTYRYSIKKYVEFREKLNQGFSIR